ncbi:acetoacetate decarboxylase family protein [Ideonella sp. B508-1]|uniref:acetoacetate decarboxylase family protein n=1 Tax=Ideonella sp. B508-1 TaxID=137716 RepID=UPI000347B771|nr:acetoacetate decarboxylase family protein [Ideonella sp. B508-1]
MTDWNRDPFFQVPLNLLPTSEGEVAMPILYHDNSNFLAMFWVDHPRAQAQTDADGFEAVRFGNGKALAVVAFYEYRQTAIGPYNEVGVAIAAVPPGTALPRSPLRSLLRTPDRNPVGFDIIDLPVTTPAACAAGREIWGYPKFVTPIRFSLGSGQFCGTVKDPAAQGPIVTLSGRMGLSVPAPLLDLVLFSRHRDQILRGSAITRGGGRLCLPGSVRLEVSDSAHRMANHLRELGLDGARPFCVSHTHRLQLRLNAGAVVG